MYSYLRSPFSGLAERHANLNADPIVVGELPQQGTHQFQQLYFS